LDCPRFGDALLPIVVSEGYKGRGEAQRFVSSSTVGRFSIADKAIETRAMSTFRRWRMPWLVFVHDLVRWKMRKEVFHQINGRIIIV